MKRPIKAYSYDILYGKKISNDLNKFVRNSCNKSSHFSVTNKRNKTYIFNHRFHQVVKSINTLQIQIVFHIYSCEDNHNLMIMTN